VYVVFCYYYYFVSFVFVRDLILYICLGKTICLLSILLFIHILFYPPTSKPIGPVPVIYLQNNILYVKKIKKN